MKKLVVAFAVLIAAVFTSNAQVFVGGGLGVEFGGGKSTYGGTSVDAPSTLALYFAPKAGFYLSDNFAVGMEAGFLTGTEKQTSGSTEIKNNLFGWGVSGFARYRLAGDEKLSLLLEGSVGAGGLKNKRTVGANTTDGDPMFAFAIGVLPVLSYSLTDRLNIEASCDFLSFGFQSIIEKDKDDATYKYIENYFGFGVNSLGFNMLGLDEYLGISNMIKIGIVFKF